MQKGAPLGGQTLPGMSLDEDEADADELPPARRKRPRPRGDWPAAGGRGASGRWWWPAKTLGRGLVTLAALVILCGLTAAGVLLDRYLQRDPRFRIAGAGNIDATGMSEVSRAEMLPVFGEDIGRNIFFVPLAERRRQLEQIPWVERATVMRFLPDQLRVSIVERQPVAFVRQGQQIGLVDADGVLLTMPADLMAAHHYSFPVVTGIDANDPQLARKARMGLYVRLLAELDSNGQRLSEQISEIDLTDPEDARVLMPEPGSDILAHFGEERFLERYQRYKSHIVEWRQQYPRLAGVDLRYDSQVVLEMQPGVNAVQPATDADATKPADGQPDPRPALDAKADAPAKPPAGVKAATRPAAVKASAKPKPRQTAAKAAIRAATLRDKKKRAAQKRAALSLNKTKPTSKPHPGAVAGQGQ